MTEVINIFTKGNNYMEVTLNESWMWFRMNLASDVFFFGKNNHVYIISTCMCWISSKSLYNKIFSFDTKLRRFSFLFYLYPLHVNFNEKGQKMLSGQPLGIKCKKSWTVPEEHLKTSLSLSSSLWSFRITSSKKIKQLYIMKNF